MRKITVIIALFLAAIQIVSAQKVGLVLSGGGAKGAAHIGVIKALEEKKATAQARIMEVMGAAERGGYGSYSVTWKTQKRSTFDRKKWEKDHGEIPQNYFKSSESRTFRFKKENI